MGAIYLVKNTEAKPVGKTFVVGGKVRVLSQGGVKYFGKIKRTNKQSVSIEWLLFGIYPGRSRFFYLKFDNSADNLPAKDLHECIRNASARR